jgi:AraC-like DNA-binding protein
MHGRHIRPPTTADRAQLDRAMADISTLPRLAFSRKEAAAALGMSLRHFQRHVQPQLRCVYCGQLRLYPVAELERWMRLNSSTGFDKW